MPDELSCTNHPDAFALELAADGSQLLASTYVGGAGYEDGLGIAVDAAGRSYVAGSSSSPYGFPLVDAFQATMVDNHRWCAARADCSDAFLVRLDPGKSQVEYGTFHGGLSQDQARGVALADGDAWIAGLTHSPNLATTADPWAGGNCDFLRDSLEFPSCSDAFIARIDEAKPPTSPPSGGSGGSGGSSGGATGGSPGGATVGSSGGTTVEPSGGTTVEPSGGGAAGTVAPPRVDRALTFRVRGGRVVGRIRAAEAPRCARRVQVRLEKRGRTTWRLVATARTGADRRFALRLPRTTRPLRVRLPSLTRTDAGTLVRCAGVTRRVQP